LTLEVRRAADGLTVHTQQAESQVFSWVGSDYAYLDLEVRVPASLAIAIATTSGDVEAADLASLEFDSLSGDLDVRRVAGAVVAGVRSGDIRAEEVGRFELRHCGLGELRLRHVHGPVKVGPMGFGDLDLRDIEGDVEVAAVESGDTWSSTTSRAACGWTWSVPASSA
jgi:hypothetical protein